MLTPERKNRITKVLNSRQPDLAVIMEDIEDPHNIFAVMRTCDAVGIQEVYIINTPFKKHKKFGKSSSSGAAKWLTVHHYDNIDECIHVVKSKYDAVLASYLGEKSTSFYDIDFTRSVALAFGNERKGMSDAFIEHCDGTFIIPQAGMIRSLNISVACAVTLYEAKRQRIEKGYYNGDPRLQKKEWDALSHKWESKIDKNKARG